VEPEPSHVEYASPEQTPGKTTLESGPGWATLIVPPPPGWIALAGLIGWSIILSAHAVLLTKMFFMLRRMGFFPFLPAKAWIATFALPVVFIAVGAVVIGGLFADHFRHHRIARRLEARDGTLRHTRRGWWGARYREYQPERIRSVRVTPLKDIFGRRHLSMLEIRLGRWQVIRAGLKSKDECFARDVESAFQAALGKSAQPKSQ
jgi:hypothetical protein